MRGASGGQVIGSQLTKDMAKGFPAHDTAPKVEGDVRAWTDLILKVPRS